MNARETRGIARKPRLGCPVCRNQAEPGSIEIDNNGPIVPCRCNPVTEKDMAWDRAETERDRQRRPRPAPSPSQEVRA